MGENVNNRTVDDKDLVILAITLIVVMTLFKLNDPVEIINNALAGLLGMAVGRR